MKLTVCCMIICLAYVLTCFASPAKAPKGKEKASEVKEHPAKASKGKAKASEVKAHPSKASKGKAKASEVKAHPSKASKGKRLGKCTTDAQCPPGFVCSEVRTGKSKKGRSGKKCYPAPNICDSSPCLNNGTCVDNGNGTFTCICESGYTDTNCSVLASGICDSSPCLNNGTCVDNGNGTFTCICESGYTGTNCSVLASGICDSSPCLNNGTCVDNGNGTFTCICDSCYIGRNCSEAVEPCPPGWELLFSGSCYFSSSEQKTWADARADCIARGGYLVEIESYEENEFLYSYGKGDNLIALN
ncbi:fibropellin-1-like isoform X2 [Mercenaria mercenaria]|uniref:fibropellin-1-like isoform X2 n=1 Tax=Mercenaria mercenaria TaxID=6596 RepID=UPI00234F68A7|nr:fibropellin-1-like isoform X2 [Mercenaria mercenaria]